LDDRIDDMIGTYEKLLSLAPDNLVALNNLAWYLRDRDPKKALEYAEKAHELAPKSAAILDTYALALLANGDTAKALRQIERAVQAEPDNPSLQLHHAQILAAAGQKEQAVSTLKSLLQERKTFPEREEAETLLEKLK
jgi:predicted Zn-dependent protease